MTPEQKLKHMILLALADMHHYDYAIPAPVTADNIDQLYQEAYDDERFDGLQDPKSDIRGGQFETGLRCESSRHYESKAVAAKAPDGSWVGWTYWYGGGKHGEPEAVDWIEYAYNLTCVEEEKVVTVRTFTIAE